MVHEINKASVTGYSLVAAPINKPTSFIIQNLSGSVNDLRISIEDPYGQSLPFTIKESSPRNYKVHFTPKVIGEHRILLNHFDTPMNGSPFISKVYDISKIKVSEIRFGLVGNPVTFLVETEDAGPGNLEVMINDGLIETFTHAESLSRYVISFYPRDEQTHFINIKFNGEPVPGSPFECLIVNPESLSRVQIISDGLQSVPVNYHATFHINTKGVNLGQPHVTVTGPNQQHLEITLSGHYETGFSVEYTPVEVGDHTIDIRMADQFIGQSPYLVKVFDSTKVKLRDVGNGVVGKPVYFSIDASEAGTGNLEISVSVAGRNVPNYVQSEGNAHFRVNFKPSDPQTHVLSVKFNEQHVPGSPFYIKVMNSCQPLVSGTSLKMTSISRGANFTVDTRGQQNMKCDVEVTAPSSKTLPVDIKVTSYTTFDVYFSTTEVGPHLVAVMLDGMSVPDSPFTCNVYDATKVRVTHLLPGVVGESVTFQVNASQAGEGTLELIVTTHVSSVPAEVTTRSRGVYDVTFVPQKKVTHYVNISFNEEDIPGPMDMPVQSSLVQTGDSSYLVQYLAQVIGTYRIEVLHKGIPVTRKPYLVQVCDPRQVRILDLDDGVLNRVQKFKVDTSRAGLGQVSVNITVNNQGVQHAVQEIGRGIHLVTYTPKSVLPHNIEVLLNGHIALGCPQLVQVRDPSQSVIAYGSGLKCVSLHTDATFLIETGGAVDANKFDIFISSPRCFPLPVKCYQQKDGNLLAEWTPDCYGEHKIHICYMDVPIDGSPYTCQVFDSSKVMLQKTKNTIFSVGKKISFTVSLQEAGHVELNATVLSPLGHHTPIEVKGAEKDEEAIIEFVPKIAGKYKVGITYGEIDVPGSPVTFIVQEEGGPIIEGKGLAVACVNITATFTVNACGLSGRPNVRIEGPEREAECSIEEENGVFIVSYVPEEVGVFDVRILWNGQELPASPYHPRVVDPQKVRAIGGWETLLDESGRISLVAGEKKKIPFDITDAGPGILRVELHGPEGMIEHEVKQVNNHRYMLHFIPLIPGEYYLYLYYADIPLPKSPYLAFAKAGQPVLDHSQVMLRGHGLKGGKVGEEAQFLIDGSEAGPGSPEVKLSGVKASIQVKLLPQGNNIYKAVYTPIVPGSYLLDITWSKRQIKGCPLKVAVSASCDSTKVICSGDGLREGTVGKEIKVFIDTRKAGPGELTTQCLGPYKAVHCQLYDHRDGTFSLYLKPQEGGHHVLTIKYEGSHVPGSPFAVSIAGPHDASRVRVYGPGVEPGVLALYEGKFMCDTRGAGAGQLTVRVRGPKGTFRVEMWRESQKDQVIHCNYNPTEPGFYHLEIKWSGEHVPGSPFVVAIFDTQEEVTRYLQGHHIFDSLSLSGYFDGNMTSSTGFGQISWHGSVTEL